MGWSGVLSGACTTFAVLVLYGLATTYSLRDLIALSTDKNELVRSANDMTKLFCAVLTCSTAFLVGKASERN
jgi:hypothetical protein